MKTCRVQLKRRDQYQSDNCETNNLFQRICKLWPKPILTRKESKYGKTKSIHSCSLRLLTSFFLYCSRMAPYLLSQNYGRTLVKTKKIRISRWCPLILQFFGWHTCIIKLGWLFLCWQSSIFEGENYLITLTCSWLNLFRAVLVGNLIFPFCVSRVLNSEVIQFPSAKK